jgi:peroxiredoxin
MIPVAEPEDSYPNMIKRAKEKGYTFPYLLDSTQQTAKTYGAKRTPHVYLLSKTVCQYFKGGIHRSY